MANNEISAFDFFGDELEIVDAKARNDIKTLNTQYKDIANNFTTEQTDNSFIIKYNDNIIATIPLGKIAVDNDSNVSVLYDFSNMKSLNTDIFSRYIDDSEYTYFENGLLNLKVKNVDVVNNTQVKNLLDIDKFDSDYFRIDVEAIYSEHSKGWDCICLWNYGSKWDSTGNVGIWSAIGGETDVYEQSMPSGNPNTKAGCIIHAGNDIDDYTLHNVVGNQVIEPGVLHKYSCIIEKHKRTFLYDDVITCVYEDDTFRTTNNYTYDRNTLALPVWVNFFSQVTNVTENEESIFKIKSIKFSTVDEKDVIEPTSVSLSNDYINNSVVPGVKLFMIKNVQPEKTTNKFVTWESTNPTVATVSKAGLVTTLTEGETIIKATTPNGVVGEYNLTVSNNADISCKKIQLSTNTINVTLGETANIETPVLFPSYTTKSVTYESLNSTVATISDTGVITPQKIGSCQIKVVCGDIYEIINCNVLDATGLLSTITLEDTKKHTGSCDVDFVSSYSIKFDVETILSDTSENGISWGNETFIFSNETSPFFRFNKDSGTSGIYFNSGGANIKIGEVSMANGSSIIVTWDLPSLTQKIYIDKTLVSEKILNKTFVNSFNQRGSNIKWGSYGVKGVYKIYNKALSDEEIQNI